MVNYLSNTPCLFHVMVLATRNTLNCHLKLAFNFLKFSNDANVKFLHHMVFLFHFVTLQCMLFVTKHNI